MKMYKNRSRLGLIAIIITVLVGSGFIAYTVARKQGSPVKKTENVSQTPSSDESNSQTRQETSEGTTFVVPKSVPKDAVKNYTLITENEEFKIRQEPGTSNYIITLYAIINNPSQYSNYQDQLREYKQKALSYLTDSSVDLKKSSITYEPQEATQL